MPIYVAPSPRPWNELRKRLAAMLAYGTLARSGAFIPALREAASDLLEWMLREYNGRSRRDWKRIHPWTYALSKRRATSPLFLNPGQERRASHYFRRNRERNAMRARGRTTRPAVDFIQLAMRAQRAKPLIDTGETRASLIQGRPFNVFEIGPQRAVVGSRNPILVKHQTEHGEAFVFDKTKESRLKRNVPPKVGRRWNRLYFMLRAIMRRASGKSFTIPARPLPTKPPQHIVAKLRRDIGRLVAEQLKRAFNV